MHANSVLGYLIFVYCVLLISSFILYITFVVAYCIIAYRILLLATRYHHSLINKISLSLSIAARCTDGCPTIFIHSFPDLAIVV